MGLRKVTELPIVEHVNDTDYLILDQNGEAKRIPGALFGPNEADAVELLAELGVAEPIADSDGAVFIEDTGTIYVL